MSFVYADIVSMVQGVDAANRCPKCGKPFVTIDTKVRGDSRIRYTGCRKCKTKGPKLVIPLQFAPFRQVGFAKRRSSCGKRQKQ